MSSAGHFVSKCCFRDFIDFCSRATTKLFGCSNGFDSQNNSGFLGLDFHL